MIDKSAEFKIYGSINPVINRCFHTKKSALPEQYHERTTLCYELEYVTWGEGSVLTNGVSIPAVTGTLFFRKPGMRIHGFLPYASYGILMDSFPVEDLPLCCNFGSAHTVDYLFRDIYRHYLTDDPLSQLKMKANILNIIYCVQEHTRHSQQQPVPVNVQYYTKRLSAVTEYIETHLDQRIQLQELADLCGISSGFLSRIFKQVYHETVVEYINRQRIYRAKKLLIETNQPVSNICVTCGFWNESYFYRIFKKSQQMSPSDFRKMHRQPFVDLDELPEYLDESN